MSEKEKNKRWKEKTKTNIKFFQYNKYQMTSGFILKIRSDALCFQCLPLFLYRCVFCSLARQIVDGFTEGCRSPSVSTDFHEN